MPTTRRILVVLVLTILSYLAVNDAWSMFVVAPSGESTLTADQQAQLNQDRAADSIRQFDAAVASFNAWHHCESVADWLRVSPNTVPARMVTHAVDSERFVISAWSMPPAPRQYVSGLCS